MTDKQITPAGGRKIRTDLTKEELERLQKYVSIDSKSPGAVKRK
jgi:hypothetical protein